MLRRPFAARAREVLCNAVLNGTAPADVIIAALQQQSVYMAMDSSVIDGFGPWHQPRALLGRFRPLASATRVVRPVYHQGAFLLRGTGRSAHV